VVGEGTAAILRAQPDMDVVSVAPSLETASEAGLFDRQRVDVVLLDIRLGADSGLRALSQAGAAGPGAAATGTAGAAGTASAGAAGSGAAAAGAGAASAGGPSEALPFGEPGERPAIIVLTAYDYPQYAEAALRLGAAGFVLKTAPLPELVDAIRRVAAGGLAFSVRPTSAGLARLSPREHDVVRLVADGRTNDEIGSALQIGSKTVETHLARLFERLGVASRTELAMRAVREGWLDVPPDR
jgi:DNA-binding NarL/FixJ family response regulator